MEELYYWMYRCLNRIYKSGDLKFYSLSRRIIFSAMNKITFLLPILIFASCNSKIKQEIALKNLKIDYNDYVTFDFKTNSIKIEMDTFKLVDSLILTDENFNILSKSFDESKISEIKGEKFYADKNMSFPEDFIVLKFQNGNGGESKIIVSKKMALTNSVDSNKIVGFKNLLINILEKNKKFQKDLELSYDQQIKTKNILF